MPNKRIRLFAGPNGSGKSSLFHEFSKNYSTGFFVNADDLERKLIAFSLIDLKEVGVTATQKDLDDFSTLPSSVSLLTKAEVAGHKIDVSIVENCIVDKSRTSHSYEASYIAAFIRYLLVRENKSFSFETVMSHKAKIAEVEDLVNKDYQAYLYFVCIDDPEVNISRVINRVEKGGHQVSPQKVMERYYRALSHLHEVLPFCYRAYLFDNSGKKQVLVAELYKGAMELKTDTPPQWFIDYILPYYQ